MRTTADLLNLADGALLKTYKQPPLVLTRGEGCRVWDTDGREYLDLFAGIAVSVLGHAHPALVQAVASQAARLIHVSNYFYNDRQVEFASALVRAAGMDRAFLCNSGAEANEGALKLCRRHHFTRGDTERVDVIATHQSFHGRTLGALALTGQPKYWEGFGPRLSGVSHVPYGDLQALEARMNDRTAAVIVEPIQGEAGVLVPPKGYLQGVRDLCHRRGALFIADEIQTGVGRTGRFLACQREGVEADVVTLAKGIAGGVPVGAFLVRSALAGALVPGTHGTTFGGNALAAAAGLAVLGVLESEGLFSRAEALGEVLAGRLRALCEAFPSAAVEARGVGLMQGLELHSSVDPREVLARLRDRGVLLSLGGDRVLRFVPALTITREELDRGVDAVAEVLQEPPRTR
ncbi:MAG: acetylornithine transaminase [Deltaproteobacteria bacterium]|nr:acetylornithine transaminase [Deltaproteobacteria bacterium]